MLTIQGYNPQIIKQVHKDTMWVELDNGEFVEIPYDHYEVEMEFKGRIINNDKQYDEMKQQIEAKLKTQHDNEQVIVDTITDVQKTLSKHDLTLQRIELQHVSDHSAEDWDKFLAVLMNVTKPVHVDVHTYDYDD